MLAYWRTQYFYHDRAKAKVLIPLISSMDMSEYTFIMFIIA